MKFYIRNPNSDQFGGPFTIEDIRAHIKAGALSPNDEVLEAMGQTYRALKRSTEWKKISDYRSWAREQLLEQPNSVAQSESKSSPALRIQPSKWNPEIRFGVMRNLKTGIKYLLAGVLLILIALGMWGDAQDKIRHPEKHVYDYINQEVSDLSPEARIRVKSKLNAQGFYGDSEFNAYKAKEIKSGAKVQAGFAVAIGLIGVGLIGKGIQKAPDAGKPVP